MSVEVNIQETPNPNAIKFSVNQVIFEGSKSMSLKSGDETDHVLASALVGIEGVDNIFGINDFVTITKEADAEWDDILPKVEKAFNEL
jgi:hypothetical protein